MRSLARPSPWALGKPKVRNGFAPNPGFTHRPADVLFLSALCGSTQDQERVWESPGCHQRHVPWRTALWPPSQQVDPEPAHIWRDTAGEHRARATKGNFQSLFPGRQKRSAREEVGCGPASLRSHVGAAGAARCEHGNDVVWGDRKAKVTLNAFTLVFPTACA